MTTQSYSPFTTSVVGSWIRPKELLDAFREFERGEYSAEQLEPYVDRAVKRAIDAQENAGIDVITDGEQGRVSFVTFVGQKIHDIALMDIDEVYQGAKGMLKERNTMIPYTRAIPTGHLPDDAVLALDEVENARKYSSKPIKVTLPSPYLLMWETWNDQLSGPFYSSPEDLAYAYVRILRNEIVRLRDAGVSMVQIDEPMLGNLLEANGKPDRYREIFASLNGHAYRGFKEELTLAKDLMNALTNDIDGINIAMHVCHWPNPDSTNYGTGVERLLPDLFEFDVDQFVLEYAAPGSSDPVDLVRDFPKNRQLGLGVVDVRSKEVETPESIVESVEGVTKYIQPDQIWLNPDCGFAPGKGRRFPEDIAEAKLRSMAQAAKILRERYA